MIARNGHTYFFKPDHRDRTAIIKSQWDLEPSEELELFVRSHVPDALVSWGVLILGNSPSKLGESATAFGRARRLHIAKFICRVPIHGYPADTERNVQDIPPIRFVNELRTSGFITKSQAIRLKGQKPWA